MYWNSATRLFNTVSQFFGLTFAQNAGIVRWRVFWPARGTRWLLVKPLTVLFSLSGLSQPSVCCHEQPVVCQLENLWIVGSFGMFWKVTVKFEIWKLKIKIRKFLKMKNFEILGDLRNKIEQRCLPEDWCQPEGWRCCQEGESWCRCAD